MHHRIIPRLGATALLLFGLASAEPYTPKHEPGRCAFRGHCGKQSLFGKELPCVDNDLAKDPDAQLRDELVDLCGEKWRTGPVCCTLEQVGIYNVLKIQTDRRNLGTISQVRTWDPKHSHWVVSCLQRQLFQYVLYLHMFSRPISLRQRHAFCQQERKATCYRA